MKLVRIFVLAEVPDDLTEDGVVCVLEKHHEALVAGGVTVGFAVARAGNSRQFEALGADPGGWSDADTSPRDDSDAVAR